MDGSPTPGPVPSVVGFIPTCGRRHSLSRKRSIKSALRSGVFKRHAPRRSVGPVGTALPTGPVFSSRTHTCCARRIAPIRDNFTVGRICAPNYKRRLQPSEIKAAFSLGPLRSICSDHFTDSAYPGIIHMARAEKCGGNRRMIFGSVWHCIRLSRTAAAMAIAPMARRPLRAAGG